MELSINFEIINNFWKLSINAQCQIPGHSSDKNCLNFRFCLTLEDEKIQVVQNFGYKKTFLFLNQFQNFLRLWVKKDQNFTLKLPIQD